MKRLIALATVAWMTMLGLVAVGAPAHARTAGPNGQIAFFRYGPQGEAGPLGTHLVYTVNPDGTHVRQLLPGSHPRWSPDGTEIAIDGETDALNTPSAFIVDADTGSLRTLFTDPTLYLVCTVWSPNGGRLACASFNGDLGGDPSRDGIYTIRSSDGGDLTRVTPFGAVPGDYSPDGKRLVLLGWQTDPPRLYVIKLNGTGLTPITPPGMALTEDQLGSWSPSGAHILFSGHADSEHSTAIWEVNPDGSGLHQVPIPGCGGALSDPTTVGCLRPRWSPDGTKFAFDRFDPNGGLHHIYTVNADGSGLFQVTRSGFDDEAPDWGTHPLAT